MAMNMNPGIKNEVPKKTLLEEAEEKEALLIRSQYIPFPIPSEIANNISPQRKETS